MAQLTRITGMNKVLSNLKKSSKTTVGGMERGLKLAGLFLQRESQKIVPVDTGNLKGGAFTRNIGGSGAEAASLSNADIVVGYVANYAVYVHEDLQASHQSGKSAKFLEQPAREHRKKMLDIIAEEARGV